MLQAVLKILALLIMCFNIIACNAEDRHVVAEICVTVNIQNEDQTKELIRWLDEFANSVQMSADKSHPLAVVYKDESKQNVVSVDTHFGSFGVLISSFRFDENLGLEIRDKLKSFVWTDLSAVYDVKNCEDIEGFKLPELWL